MKKMLYLIFALPLSFNAQIELSEIMKGKINQVFHREYLKGKDYSFDVLTHYQKYKGNNEQAVYDFLIVEKEGLLNIIRYD